MPKAQVHIDAYASVRTSSESRRIDAYASPRSDNTLRKPAGAPLDSWSKEGGFRTWSCNPTVLLSGSSPVASPRKAPGSSRRSSGAATSTPRQDAASLTPSRCPGQSGRCTGTPELQAVDPPADAAIRCMMRSPLPAEEALKAMHAANACWDAQPGPEPDYKDLLNDFSRLTIRARKVQRRCLDLREQLHASKTQKPRAGGAPPRAEIRSRSAASSLRGAAAFRPLDAMGGQRHFDLD